MAEVIRMPRLSDTMAEGVIVAWNKKVGDKIKPGDVLAEVETDKATMELESYNEGTLLYIGVEKGKAAKVDGVIAIIGKEGEDYKAALAAAGNDNGKQTAQETETPAKKEDKENAKKEGSVPAASTQNNQSPQQEKNETGQMSIGGTTQGAIGGTTEDLETSDKNERIKASPLAKKLAADKGIDISRINGSGDGGRITKKDVDGYQPGEEARQQPAETKATVPAFTNNAGEGYTDVPVTQMRKTIARRVGESKFNAPHFYLTIEINMDNAIASRKAINEVSPVKISYNDMLIKVCAVSLRLHPDVNSSWMGDYIRQNHHIHIGSAVAMPEGLIVPVIRFADQKTLSQIAAEAKQLYTKAKDKKLQPDEFSGNTFTISNLGMMDIEEFTAIINPPDSCILAIGKIKEIVVKKENGFDVTNVMKVTLSCDHRSVDGSVGAAFLQTLKRFMENPVTMLV